VNLHTRRPPTSHSVTVSTATSHSVTVSTATGHSVAGPNKARGSSTAMEHSSWSMSANEAVVWATGAIALVLLAVALVLERLEQHERRGKEAKRATSSSEAKLLVRVVYASTTGKCKAMAEKLVSVLNGTPLASFPLEAAGALHDLAARLETSLVRADEYDLDNLPLEQVMIVVFPTWEGGTPPESGKVFFEHVVECSKDFRVQRGWLGGLALAMCATGSSEYGPERFCAAAKALEKAFSRLGASRLCGRMDGDDSQDMDAQFHEWVKNLVVGRLGLIAGGRSLKASLEDGFRASGVVVDTDSLSTGSSTASSTGSRRKKKGKVGMGREGPITAALNAAAMLHAKKSLTPESAAEIAAAREEAEDRLNSLIIEAEEAEAQTGALDIEDMGRMMEKIRETRRVAEEAEAASAAVRDEDRPAMVTPAQRKALTKEGYRVLGSHSAVKLCRWTKHSLRGRGMCYKQSAYGIKSYQCMELTPSLACANKCTFCWRHHTNPVGREWRWRTDPPEAIVRAGIEAHVRMIHGTRGFPGLKMDRWTEAHTVRHCALSLVGEPIMYPHINELISQLHARKISSFLVTNAQFPAAIRALHPVTQLYVSVDAGDKETLRKTDRPLFSDFWERFIDSLRSLRRKKLRTVYRLTLVKRYNVGQGGDEMENYCDLVRIGDPDLIEVKAVTFCGSSPASDITVHDVPYHAEVRAFCEDMSARLGGVWEPACEHAHSNLVVLARKETFFKEGKWHTWIDYDRFHELAAEWRESFSATVDSGKSIEDVDEDVPFSFSAADYMAPTPEWAVYNAPEAGFSPEDVRFYRSKSGKVEPDDE
jgi:tRNA wybutosine-synthesizing protein 1